MESFKICSFCFPGSHGCHLLSTEPENKSACAGARSSLQPSPETQYEETDLDRHVGKHTAHPPSLTSLSVRLSYAKKKKRKKAVVHAHADQNHGQSHLLSHLLTYLFDTPQHMHANKSAHTGRRLKRKRRRVTYLLLLWRQPCVYFYSFHMHSPSSPFILSSLWREETHQLMFSFTVIGWFKAASVNCAPPPLPISPLLFIYTLPLPSSSLPFLFTLVLFTVFFLRNR